MNTDNDLCESSRGRGLPARFLWSGGIVGNNTAKTRVNIWRFGYQLKLIALCARESQWVNHPPAIAATDCKEDPKVDVLSEINNTCRTLIDDTNSDRLLYFRDLERLFKVPIAQPDRLDLESTDQLFLRYTYGLQESSRLSIKKLHRQAPPQLLREDRWGPWDARAPQNNIQLLLPAQETSGSHNGRS